MTDVCVSWPRLRFLFWASSLVLHCRQPLAACDSMSCSCRAPTEVTVWMAARTASAILSVRSLSVDLGPSFRAPSAKCWEGPPETVIQSTRFDHHLQNTSTKKAPERAPELTTIYKTRAPKKHQKEHQN